MSSILASMAVAYGAPYAPPGPSGAGRYRSVVWPDPFILTQTGVSPAVQQARGRINTGPTTLQTGIAGGASILPGLINGIAGALITNNPGFAYVRLHGANINIKTSQSAMTVTQGPNADDSTCIRTWCNMACSVGAPNTNDQGFYMVLAGGASQRVIIDAVAGFGFQIGQTGVVSFCVRGPNGLILTPLTAAPFDVTKHHTYELWMVGAGAGPGALFALIDGVPCALPALSRTWGAGTNLPPNVTTSGISGFDACAMSNNGTVGSTVHVQQLGVAYAPTLPALT